MTAGNVTASINRLLDVRQVKNPILLKQIQHFIPWCSGGEG